MVLALLHLLTPSWLSVSLGRGRKKKHIKGTRKKNICVLQNKVRIWPKVGFWVTLHLYTVCFPQDPPLTPLFWAYGCREQVSVLLKKEKKGMIHRQSTLLYLVSVSLTQLVIKKSSTYTSHAWTALPAWSICMMSFLCSLQILMNARRGGTPVPTTQCASTWKEAMTAGAPTGTTARATVSMTTRSSTVGRSGCWTAIGALCAPARWETDGDRHGEHRDN